MLTKAMRAGGFDVIETASDFFLTNRPAGATHLITNPPYSIKYAWVERSLSFGIPAALLMPVEALGTAALWRACSQVVPALVIVLPRISFKMPSKNFWKESA